MHPRPLALVLSALLGAGTAGLVACGDSDRAGLIPAGSASSLDQALQQVADATGEGECARALAGLRTAQRAFAALPASVDPRLRARIAEGLEQLVRTVPDQCRENRTTTTETTPTETTTTEPPPTETTTQTTTEPPPTQTTTQTTTEPPPTETTTTTPPQPPPNPGGVSPDQGQDGGSP